MEMLYVLPDKKAMSENTIYTIGHSTRSIESFLEMLKSFNIKTLVDVRHFPGSRKFPHFNKEALSASLAAESIRYEHIESLGGRRKPLADSPNTAWRHTAFRGYADHMESEEFKQGIERLKRLALNAPTAFMCSEAVWWRCHRSLISDLLKSEGWNVQHIMEVGTSKEHPYTAPAKIMEGRLSYH